MSFDKKRPDFYDETVVNHNEYAAIAKNVQTKIFDRQRSVDIADPNKTVDTTKIRPWRVCFSIESSRVELVFEVKDVIQIGRSARYDMPFDGIDLSPFNGHELGVSRLHAEISLRNEQIIITDKGSANGTLLNQQKLEPETPYRLKHGDYISFGNMPISIYFLTPIFQIT